MYKLNILLQCQSLGVGKGGAERVTTEMANEMANRGHTVHIGYKDNGPPAYLVENSVNLLPYNSMRRFTNQVRSINPDLFFTFYVNRLLINNYAIVQGTDIPFGMQECTNPMRLCTNNWDSLHVSPAIARWEREIIASGAACIRLTMPNYKLSFPNYIQPRIRAFSNPAFPQKTLAMPGDTSSERKVILKINGFKQNKNLITLIKAFSRLATDFSEWDLRVVGKSSKNEGSHNIEILQFIQEKNLQNRIQIQGPTDDMHAEFAAAHIHVISSLSEGCPTVVLEAMSAGLPSVGFNDCPGTNELIRHESNGLLASPEDRVAGLEASLEKLMSSPELRNQFGHQALEDSLAYDPKNIYDQWEQLFIEGAEYKNDPERLFREQMAIDPERAMHAGRMRRKIMQQFKG